MLLLDALSTNEATRWSFRFTERPIRPLPRKQSPLSVSVERCRHTARMDRKEGGCHCDRVNVDDALPTWEYSFFMSVPWKPTDPDVSVWAFSMWCLFLLDYCYHCSTITVKIYSQNTGNSPCQRINKTTPFEIQSIVSPLLCSVSSWRNVLIK